MKVSSAAVVTIFDAAKFSKKGRKSVANWLRSQARQLEQFADEYAGRYTARYLYRGTPFLRRK